MTTSTLLRSSVCARSGGSEGECLPDVVQASPVPSWIRMAGLVDIPGIEKITREGPQKAGIESAATSRATRLFLANVAFELGALWVEQVEDEPITRAAAAIPAGQLLAQHSAMRNIIRQVGRPAAPALVPFFGFGFGEALLAELKSVKPVWLLIEFSNASQSGPEDLALLEAGLLWTREHSESGRNPLMVLTDRISERRAAESLGFVERRTSGGRRPWWLGGAGPVERAFGA